MHDRIPDQNDGERAPSFDTLQKLVENHREFLAFLERRLGDRTIAEDVLQDAFVRSVAKLEQLRDDESARAWFYRVLRNAVIDQSRRRATAERKLEALALQLESGGSADSEVDREVCACVSRLAATLKPEYARALQRIEVEGIPVKEFARETGLSDNNAAVRVFRAREALRRQVARSCGTCAEHGCFDCSCART